MPSPPIIILSFYSLLIVNTKLSPSCLINKLWRSGYWVTRMATLHDYIKMAVSTVQPFSASSLRH